jgi:UDP-2,3-diacylglucosamine pyrophosphatase LpxH
VLGEIAAIARDPNKTVHAIELVLLGDIFDLVRSDYWLTLPHAQRPWNGTLSSHTGMSTDEAGNESRFAAVLRNVLAQECAQRFVAGIRNLPEASGKPVALTYVVGNHDRVLHNYDGLKSIIKDAFSPLDVSFRTELQLDEYAVAARHGHEWDENCHGWKFAKVLQGKALPRFDRTAYLIMAIGEVITAELMAGLVFNARNMLRPQNPADALLLKALGDVNNLRPMTDVVPWIGWMGAQQTGKYLQVCHTAFRDALRSTLATDLARKWDKLKVDWLISGDITDTLAKVLWIMERKNGLTALQDIMKVALPVKAIVDRISGQSDHDALASGAAEQFKTQTQRTQYLVYGHTHQARQDYFSATVQGGVKMYVNTGTFLPVIMRAADAKSFARSNRLSFVCFYNREEDTRDRADDGPTVEIWDGVKRKRYVSD